MRRWNLKHGQLKTALKTWTGEGKKWQTGFPWISSSKGISVALLERGEYMSNIHSRMRSPGQANCGSGPPCESGVSFLPLRSSISDATACKCFLRLLIHLVRRRWCQESMKGSFVPPNSSIPFLHSTPPRSHPSSFPSARSPSLAIRESPGSPCLGACQTAFVFFLMSSHRFLGLLVQ